MWIVFLSFLSFCLSGIFLLPRYVEQITLPDSFFAYAPFALMAFALASQIEALKRIKVLLKAKKVDLDNDQLNIDLSAMTQKLHGEKKLVTDLRSHISQIEKDLKRLNLSHQDSQHDLQTQKSEYTKALVNMQNQHALELVKLESRATTQDNSELKLVQFLGLLQEKGQFLDFVMDDVSQYENEQVGAAARVVHQGVKQVLSEYFQVSPVVPQDEGSPLELQSNEKTHAFRLLGNIGEPPYKGTLLHKGWKARTISLPEIIDPEFLRLNQNERILAPAELELN